MQPRTILGILLIGIFGFLVVNSFGQQVAGYETFSEATDGGRRAHVVGEWIRERPWWGGQPGQPLPPVGAPGPEASNTGVRRPEP